MGERSVAKHTLGNRNPVATEKGFITGAASSLGTSVERAGNGLAIGCIVSIKTDRA
jgi:hypothetical protein